MTDTHERQPKKSFRQTPVYRAILAFFLLCGMVWITYEMYVDITQYEEGNDSLSLNVILMIAYDLLGKWGAISAWIVIASFAFWLMCIVKREG